MRICLRVAVGMLLAGCLTGCLTARDSAPRVERPNFLLVLTDDLGYSDLGAYGGEIRTPTLDALAESGLLATDFYVAPDGLPTRKMLLTGADHHVVMLREPQEADSPSQRTLTVASLLRDAGYHTYMTGRWELGSEPDQRPAAQGFEREFALLEPAASHWDEMASAIPGRERALYSQTGRVLETLPEGYFSTRHFTDFLIESIEANRADGRPFFAYLSYQAPHSPLAVPDDWLDRCAGRYDDGYDAARRRRLLRMKRLGLLNEAVAPFPGIPTVPRWGDLGKAQQRQQARKMELYAAMVENLDFHLGRLLEHLRQIGEFDNTVILFLSDNGASPKDRGAAGMDPREREWLTRAFPASEFENWGRKGSFVEYGPAWAQVSTVPFRMFKDTHAEGGIRSPLIVSGPGVAKPGRVSQSLLHVMDLTPTVLELAGVERRAAKGAPHLASLEGRSLVPLLAGERKSVRTQNDWLGFEFAGDRAVREGKWKLVWMARPFGANDWRLFRLDHDPTELYDQTEREPKKKQELLALWERYAQAIGVTLPPEGGGAPRP